MGTYCYGKGRSRVIEEFAHWQGLWILAVFSAIALETLLLYVFGYLHLDGDSSQSWVMRINGGRPGNAAISHGRG
jgi:hypothetical protein